MNQHSIKFSLKLCAKGMLTVLLFSIAVNLNAQSVKPYQPARQQVLQAYKNAALLDSLARKSIFKSYVYANWQADEKGFWYKNLLPADNVEYWYINSATSAKQKAFDHARMAQGLNKLLDTIVTADKLPISNMQFDKLHHSVTVQVAKKWYLCNLKTYNCSAADSIVIKKDDGFVTGNIKSRWSDRRHLILFHPISNGPLL